MGVIQIILLFFNSSELSAAINPKDLIPKAAAKFNGPELFPIYILLFFIALITPNKSKLEQSVKILFLDKEIIFLGYSGLEGSLIKKKN